MVIKGASRRRQAIQDSDGLWRFDMDILDVARQAGMTVVLEARIGRQEYHSVYGSLAALQSFAEQVRASAIEEAQACEHE